MTTLNATDFVDILRSIAVRLKRNSDALCMLDGEVGDGDHGTTMVHGFSTISTSFVGADTDVMSLAEFFNTCAERFLDAVGATTGPLYGSAFLKAAQYVENRRELSPHQALWVLVEFSVGIADRGNAEIGDKTMVDVWRPVEYRIRAALDAEEQLQPVLQEISELAEASSIATKTMIASKGRASRLGNRTLGHIDPGSASAALIIDTFCDTLLTKMR